MGLFPAPLIAQESAASFHSLLDWKNCTGNPSSSLSSVSLRKVYHRPLFLTLCPRLDFHPLRFHATAHSPTYLTTCSESVALTSFEKPSPGQYRSVMAPMATRDSARLEVGKVPSGLLSGVKQVPSRRRLYTIPQPARPSNPSLPRAEPSITTRIEDLHSLSA